MIRKLLLFLRALATLLPLSLSAAVPADLGSRIDSWLAPLAATNQLSGTLLVAADGVVVYERAFGLANHELRAPNTTTTRHCIASITKPLTIIAATRLAAAGTLSFDDPVAKWIPDFPGGQQVTVGHLVSHRAGIPHRVTTDVEEAMPKTAEEMAHAAGRAARLFPPGSDSAYSSAGFAVLARVLEVASGMPYARLLDEQVFAPAGAVHSAHPRGDELMPERASSYFWGVDGPENAPLKHLSFLVGGGSVFSTPRDLLAIMTRLMSGGYGPEARERLIREGGPRWNGITNGYRAFADHHPAEKLTVIFEGNLFTGAGDLVRSAVPRLARGETVEPPRVPAVTAVAASAAKAKALTGVYELRPGSRETLSFSGDRRAVRLGEWRLIPTGDDTFFSPQDYATVRAITGERGKVEALEWTRGDGSYRFSRVD